MIKGKIATIEEIEKIENTIIDEIAAAVKFADESDLPLASELYDNNYVQEDYPFITDQPLKNKLKIVKPLDVHLRAFL